MCPSLRDLTSGESSVWATFVLVSCAHSSTLSWRLVRYSVITCEAWPGYLSSIIAA